MSSQARSQPEVAWASSPCASGKAQVAWASSPCTSGRRRARAGMPVPRVVAVLLLCLPVFGQDVEIDPYLPLVLQGQWHPIVWEALIPVRTLDPATYLAKLPRPLPVEPTVPLPVVVPLPLAHAPSPSTGEDARATVPGPVAVIVPPNATNVPLPIATFHPPGRKDRGGAVNVIVPPNPTNVPLPIATFPPPGGKDKGGAVDVIMPIPAPPLAAPVQVSVTSPRPGPVKPADDANTIVLARLNAGDQSKEMLRDLAAMPLDRLTALLDRLKPHGQEQAADALVKAFLARLGVSLEQRRDWSRNVTLQVAGALGRRQDGRCVEGFEELLATRGAKTREAPWELIGLAKYHTYGGRHREAALAWLRFGDYCTFEHEIANALVEAGRSFRRAGDQTAADKALARVPGYGYGWATGLAVYDRAAALIEANRHAEARDLLKQPVKGPYAEQVAIPLDYLLGYSYRATDEAAEAKRAFGSVIERWATLASPLRGEGLEQIVEQAQRYLRELEGAGRGE